jgi:hypothetical protein
MMIRRIKASSTIPRAESLALSFMLVPDAVIPDGSRPSA